MERVQSPHRCENHPHINIQHADEVLEPRRAPPQPFGSDNSSQTHSIYHKLMAKEAQAVGMHQQQYHRQSHYVRQQQKEPHRQMELLIEENSVLRTKLLRMEQSLVNAQNIANKLYYDVQDRDQQLLRLNNVLAMGGGSSSGGLELRNEMANAQLQINYLEQELAKYRDRFGAEQQSLVNQMEDKHHEIHELKRKNCQLVELKRKLEEALDTYEFELNSSRERHDADVRQRDIRLQNMERSMKSLGHTHREQLKLMEERVKTKEATIREVTYELEKLKHHSYQSEKEKQLLQKKLQKAEEQLDTRTTVTKQLREKELQQLQDEISEAKKKRKAVQERMEKDNPETVHSKKSPKHSNEEDKLMKEFYYSPPPHKLPAYKGCSANAVSTHFSSPKIGDSKLFPASDRKDLAEDLLTKTFNSFCELIQKCNHEQLNALVLFADELPSWKKSMRTIVEHYKRLAERSSAGHLSPSDMQVILRFRTIKDKGTAGDVNRWVLDTLQFTKQKYEQDLQDPRRSDMLLFRMLIIKYRATFPRKGPRINLQEEVESLLNQQIVDSLCLAS